MPSPQRGGSHAGVHGPWSSLSSPSSHSSTPSWTRPSPQKATRQREVQTPRSLLPSNPSSHSSGDRGEFAALDRDPLPLSGQPGDEPLEDLSRVADLTFDRQDAGELTAEQAAAQIFESLSRTPLPPIHAWGDPAARHLDLTPDRLKRMIEWGRRDAPWPMSRHFDFDLAALSRLAPEGDSPGSRSAA